MEQVHNYYSVRNTGYAEIQIFIYYLYIYYILYIQRLAGVPQIAPLRWRRTLKTSGVAQVKNQRLCPALRQLPPVLPRTSNCHKLW